MPCCNTEKLNIGLYRVCHGSVSTFMFERCYECRVAVVVRTPYQTVSAYDTERIGVRRPITVRCFCCLLLPWRPRLQHVPHTVPPCDCELECWTAVLHVRPDWHGPPGVDAPAGRAGVRRAPVGSHHKHQRCSGDFRRKRYKGGRGGVVTGGTMPPKRSYWPPDILNLPYEWNTLIL